MKILFILALLATSTFAGSQPNPTPEEIKRANMHWGNLEALMAFPASEKWIAYDLPGSTSLVNSETYRQVLYRDGLRFRRNFPFDGRWKTWLIATQASPAAKFWKDIEAGARRQSLQYLGPADEFAKTPPVEINTAAKADWEQRYQEMRAEFMGDPTTTPTQKAHLQFNELLRDILKQTRVVKSESILHGSDSTAAREWLLRTQAKLIEIGTLPGWAEIPRPRLTREIKELADDLYKAWGKDEFSKAEFVNSLLACSNEHLVEFGESKVQLAKLTKEPFQLEFNAIDERPVSFAGLRGRVVLVVYWATDCVSCVAEIPTLKTLYDRYHTQGLEIIGLPADQSLPKLQQFVAARQMPWPQRFDPDKYKAENARYNFTWVSNLLLFDRAGKLVAHWNVPSLAELETLVQAELKRR